jgi:phosphoglycolate phosphatase
MTLTTPKAVIFDWDDTVVDNWHIAVETFNKTLVHMGMDALSEAEIRRRTGQSARDLFKALFGDRWEEADRVYYKTFMELVENNIRLHDHIGELLKVLSEKGIYLAVVSNKRGELLRKEVEKIGFKPYFGAVVGAGDATADKPDPAPVIMALENSGIPPGPEVWFIGDSHVDMICGHRSGCTPVLIETKTPPEDMLAENPPLRRFQKHAHIIDWINENAA